MRRPKATRQSQILQELERAPSLRVAELARRLDVSTETIRRDLDEMTARGELNRTYGGATRPPRSPRSASATACSWRSARASPAQRSR
jgi:DeoR/GlpR family transcriptional regulator of sugar metabolism